MTKAQTDKARWVAMAAYLTVIGWVLALVLHSEGKSRLTAFHLRQALGLHLSYFSLLLVRSLFNFTFLSQLVNLAVLVALLVLVAFGILGILSAAKKEEKPLPLVGAYFQRWFGQILN